MADAGMARTAPHVTLITMAGSLTTLELEGRIQSFKARHIKIVVVDMRLCVRMNSTGFQSLLSSHRLLSGPGEELRLFGLTASVQQKIARYNTQHVFHIFETESDAMKDLPANDE